MSVKKKQHFVPKSYLRNWTNDGQLYVFDTENGREYSASIDDVAAEKFFYDLNHPVDETIQKLDEDTEERGELLENANYGLEDLKDAFDKLKNNNQLIENGLSKIEEDYKNLLNKTIRSVEITNELKEEYRSKLTYYIALQWARTKEARNQLVETSLKALKFECDMHLAEKGYDIEEDTYEMEHSEQFEKLIQAKCMFSSEFLGPFMEILNSHSWFVIRNNSPLLFYTSDHPLVKEIPDGKTYQGRQGFKTEGIEISFPLSPKYCLVIVDSELFDFFGGADENEVIEIGDREYLKHYNALQVFQSYRHVISKDGKFEPAKRIYKENPEVFNENSE
jgi:hypothetical protein